LRILGVGHFVVHDSNAALISESGIVYASSEERFTRKKKDGRFPTSTLQYIATNYDQPALIAASYSNQSMYDEDHKLAGECIRRTRLAPLQRIHEKHLRDYGVQQFVGHHQSHAAGAYYTSGFDSAIIITYDGGIICEPWLATVWRGEGRRLRAIRKLTLRDGATAAVRYSAVTSLLGLRPVHDEGKVTGLSSVGPPREECIQQLSRAFAALAALEPLEEHAAYYDGRFAKQYGFIRGAFTDADIAASIQQMTEDSVKQLVKECVSCPETTNCVVAGGLFANVKLNLSLKHLGFRKLYVYPAMGDEGLGLGAALACAVERGAAPIPLDHIYCGPMFSDGDILSALNRHGLSYREPAYMEEELAGLLADGKLVGRFDGRMEFGPRALGNRSILYHTTDENINKWLNQRLQRTETMPFAPITLEEAAPDMYSDLEGLDSCTRFMTTTLPCTQKMRKLSPAVVHTDGTARPQLVSSRVSPSLYSILCHYNKLTGIPSLVNTSFNMHGEPIVCSPDDAVRCFLSAKLDYLAISRYLVPLPSIFN
jgi:carbamoyltransferase